MKVLEVFLSVVGIIALVVAAGIMIIVLADLLLSVFDKRPNLFFRKRYDQTHAPAPEPVRTNAVVKEPVQEHVRETTVHATREVYVENNNTVTNNFVKSEPQKTESSEKTREVYEDSAAELSHAVDFEAAAREREALERSKLAREEDLMKHPEQTTQKFAYASKSEAPVLKKEEDDFDFDDEFFNRTMKRKEDRIAEILEQYEDTNDKADDLDDKEEALIDLIDAEDFMTQSKKSAEKDIFAITDDIEEKEIEIKKAEDKKDEEERKRLLIEMEEAKKRKEEAVIESQHATEEIERITKEKTEAETELRVKTEEIERLRSEILALRESKTTTTTTTSVMLLNGVSEEDLLARLAILNDRLKVNEKELRKVKREYIPLSRVRRTLEADKKKLRRKEAIVAKQNVLLYGVNNYADIDDDKARKLTEEHELLDGLRMSVKHCEEVMQNNRERMPVLEQAYKILNTNNLGLRTDVEDVERQLTALRERKKDEE